MKISTILFFCASMMVVPGVYSGSTDWSTQYSSVVNYGANGSDSIDDTQAFTDAINYCKNNGYKTLYVPAGTYYISSALPALNNAFSLVSVVGESASSTVINGSGLASGIPIFKTEGGSGSIRDSGIKGLTFVGSGTQTGVSLKGSCGIFIRDCAFYSLGYGIVFSNNMTPGTFTEYCVAENCNFDTRTAVYFEKGVGDSSFHGSGIRHCTINNADGITDPVIKIGESSNPIIHLYNSPMDFQLWTRENVNVIQCNTSSDSKIILHGTITMELFDSSAPTLASGNAPVYMVGGVSCWSSPFYFGNLQLVDWLATNPNGSVNIQRKPYSVSKTLSSSSTTVSEISATKLGGIVTINITAAHYDYVYLLHIVHNGYGSDGYVTILANPRAYNVAGYGDPTFSVDKYGQLVITNSNYSGESISFLATVLGMGQRPENFLGQ